MDTKQKIDYSKIAKELAEPAIELMADLLIKHDKAILEEIHERLKKPDPDKARAFSQLNQIDEAECSLEAWNCICNAKELLDDH